MSFNPKEHMTNLKGKDYLEVKWRLVWFRDDHPNGAISTDIINFEPLVIRAVVMADGGAILATGHGSAQLKPGAVWSGREIEKAETAAIGRALGHAGYGTQFDPDDEGDYLADTPAERPQSRQKADSSGFEPKVITLSTADIDAIKKAHSDLSGEQLKAALNISQKWSEWTAGKDAALKAIADYKLAIPAESVPF